MPSRTPIRLIALAIVVLTLAACIFYGVALLKSHAGEREAARAHNELRARQLNESVAQQFDAVLRGVDTALKQLRNIYLHDRRHFDRAAREMLATYPEGMLEYVIVFAADGYLAYLSDGEDKGVYFGDREYFRVHLDDPEDRLFISRPIMTPRLATTPLIQLTRPIRDGGRLLGVIGIPLRPDYLAHKLAALRLSPQDLLSIVRTDGSFVSRSHRLDEALKTTVPPDRPYLSAQPGDRGLYRSIAKVDGIPLLFSWHRLTRWPITVVAAVNENSELLEIAHRQTTERRRAILAMAVVLLLALGLAFLLLRLGRSEKNAHDTARRLQDVMRTTQEGLWDWHLPSGQVVHNDQWYEIIGLSAGELPNTVEEFSRLVHPDDLGAVWERIDAVLKGECDVYRSEHRLLGRQGIVWVQDRGGIAERDAQGNPLRMTGSITDITLRKQAEERQRESEMLLRSAIDTLDEAFVIFDSEDRLIYCNDKYRAIYHTVADLIEPGRTFDEIVRTWKARGAGDPVDDLDAWVTARVAAHQTGSVLIQRVEDDRWVRIVEQRTVDGHIVGFRFDITELVRAREMAEAANLTKSRFLATMSHEIRTPMNGILGVAQLLMLPNVSEEERLEYARTLHTAGKNLMVLLNDILDLSKVEAGHLELRPDDFSPAAMLDEIAALFSEPAAAKHLELTARWEGPPQAIYRADPIRLRQMLTNLVSNAVKFTPQGTIHIEGREIESAGTTALLEFTVTDTGIGIPHDKQALLFQPFLQADSSITRKYGGSGLGLSIVRSLAHLMGGQAGVSSSDGAGSQFWFRVRVGRVPQGPDILPATEAARETPADPRAQLSGRVLVVEDSPANRTVIEAMLKKLGTTVLLAEDGQQGFDQVAAGTPFDLILMDLRMPVLDGYATTERIRQWEHAHHRPRLPIVAVTADAFDADRERALAAGMDDFIAKPINLDALMRVLARWLGRSPATHQDT